MKNILKLIGILCLIIIIVFIPFIINILFKLELNIWWLESEWSAGEALNFYGIILSFIGTIILGTISIWQTNKANEISRKILDKDLLESTDYIQLENIIDVSIKHNNDSKITCSAHHKLDYGASILIEPYKSNVDKLNEYLIKLYFINSSNKNHIKMIKLKYFLCVQDPDDEGLFWENKSKNPIPLRLDLDITDVVHLNWISNSEFYIQFKIYCEPNKCFDLMMCNKVNLCFIFQLNIYSFSNVETQMTYKIWISKERNGIYKVINTNAIMNDSKIINNN